MPMRWFNPSEIFRRREVIANLNFGKLVFHLIGQQEVGKNKRHKNLNRAHKHIDLARVLSNVTNLRLNEPSESEIGVSHLAEVLPVAQAHEHGRQGHVEHELVVLLVGDEVQMTCARHSSQVEFRVEFEDDQDARLAHNGCYVEHERDELLEACQVAPRREDDLENGWYQTQRVHEE